MVTATPEKSIVIENVGPIEHLDIPLQPGITVLKGLNGSGKSQALRAVERLGGNDKLKLPIRDGAKKGAVEGCGVSIVFSSRVSAHGELEVESLEGRFDLAKLVDPGIADAASADAARIKALLKLLDSPIDESVWHDLVGGVESFNTLAIELSGDLVTDAGKVKRALESQARKHETEAERLAGQYGTRMADLSDVPADVERDAYKLNAAFEAAITRKATIDQQRLAAFEHEERRREAETKLAELPASDLDELESDFRVAQDLALAAQQELIAAEKALEFARQQYAEKLARKEQAEERRNAEKRRVSDRESFESILAAAAPYKPTPEIIAEAEQALADARAAAEMGTLARQADAKAAEAAGLKKQETAQRKLAGQLRDAAKSTDEVLSDMVAKLDVGLVVYEGRLSMVTDRGTEPEPFAELSQGERWKVAMELGVLRVGTNGILPVAQEAWESLDPNTRSFIGRHAQAKGVFVVTAEAASGPLRVESYSDQIEN